MAGWVARIIALFLGVNCCVANIPKGYILRISPFCGSDSIEDARVDIITDLRAQATAVCARQEEIRFNNTDGINLHLAVSYPDQGNKPCVFQKRKDAQVYVIEVHVAWGEPYNPIHSDEEEFYVTCTFDLHDQQLSRTQQVPESFVAPVEIQTHLEVKSRSNFTLALMDVLGTALDDDDIPLGRLVFLEAESDGASGEVGIRPVSCNVVGAKTGLRHAIIRPGCGDGVVFARNNGFVTSNRTSQSPYIRPFVMSGEAAIKFDCNFTLCTEVCDGSSCASEVRDVRSVDIGRNIMRIKGGDSTSRHKSVDVLAKDAFVGDQETDDSIQLVKSNSAEDASDLYLADVFWFGMLCLGIAMFLSFCVAVCFYVRVRRSKHMLPD